MDPSLCRVLVTPPVSTLPSIRSRYCRHARGVTPERAALASAGHLRARIVVQTRQRQAAEAPKRSFVTIEEDAQALGRIGTGPEARRVAEREDEEMDGRLGVCDPDPELTLHRQIAAAEAEPLQLAVQHPSFFGGKH